ncbi:NAD/NADP-dependent octopine/nopaline dehydrogenase family protein [Staphylococcus massiliensis]|uniref:6-phosphogluconate dehydrogenase, decarboxylating n=1 Tax=Staphylococcus massiliensis S46 TaxID=1229783 RepID=K9ANM7_9STAP|nr:NAD/NADP-dependent octopine/nopaline dehydrogenase family protein [Staphylococcus massiliensis]EKU48973.1 NAD/NADP octopine/nopaline dehydrogenase family protein [Staphylococcus massiliensis S46]MCG3399413.1 NAD/NADP octopine/nopaline dehydrogenase family protein [Staphylococcus massiliensis]MCG3402487.1 NAD/NADP octopine/nopaline dehydrogenase family protein [Staphylococcus massiliensis]MCG3411549.1 NAD/NADP octopine/nopaline dehydrogenase family protein [Staphylococcus massiliensis]
MKIAIIGSGNGAVTAAVDMTDQGHDVSLYCREQTIEKFDKAKALGGFHYNNEGESSFISFTNVSHDIEHVLEGAEVVMLVIPSSHIEYYAEIMAPYIDDSQLIVFNMAASMGSIRFMNVLKKHHIETQPKFAEMNTLTYGTRVNFDTATVDLSLKVKKVYFSTYNKKDLNESFNTVKSFYPSIRKEESLLRTNLENGNPEVHPGPTLLNVGRIDYSGDFALYEEGITEHTVKLLHAIEEERLSLGRKFGYHLETAKEARIERGYLERKDDDKSLRYLFNNSPVFSQIRGPHQVENRYLTEDIAYGLVLWSSIGKAIGVRTPNIDAVITIASTILERDFFEEGLTLEALEIDDIESL